MIVIGIDTGGTDAVPLHRTMYFDDSVGHHAFP